MPEEFEFSTWLRPGAEEAYERFHRAIPADLDTVMRDAGVLNWRIRRVGSRLVHLVTAEDRDLMARRLEDDAVNRRWQTEVSYYLRESGDREATTSDGVGEGKMVWELSWPTR